MGAPAYADFDSCILEEVEQGGSSEIARALWDASSTSTTRTTAGPLADDAPEMLMTLFRSSDIDRILSNTDRPQAQSQPVQVDKALETLSYKKSLAYQLQKIGFLVGTNVKPRK